VTASASASLAGSAAQSRRRQGISPSIRSRISKFEWRITILNSTSAVWEIEMNYRSGGIGIVGVIVIVLVILWLVGVIKL
jgi:predicted component of type VI protein secretion system